MAVPYTNFLRLPNANSKDRILSSFSRARTRGSPVNACLGTSGPDEAKMLVRCSIFSDDEMLLHIWESKDGEGRRRMGFSSVVFLSLACVKISSLGFHQTLAGAYHITGCGTVECHDIGRCLPLSLLRRPLNVLVIRLLDSVKWDDKGLAVAIAQNVDTGAILMQGFVNREALSKTLTSRKATFYSRSRSSLWTKGETSKNFINICDIFVDCDRDSIIYLGKPDGPSCHTGAETCYYMSVNDVLNDSQVDGNNLALTTLYLLESIISKRKEELSGSPDGKSSWTKRLLLDVELLCAKIREEADELCRTLEEDEEKSRTPSEMADLLYHCFVLLSVRGVKIEDVIQQLRQRFAQSGIEEKSSRKSK